MLDIVEENIPGNVRVVVLMGNSTHDALASGATVNEHEPFFAQHAVELFHRSVIGSVNTTGVVVDKTCMGEKPPDLIDPCLHLASTESGEEHPLHPVHRRTPRLHRKVDHVVLDIPCQSVTGL